MGIKKAALINAIGKYSTIIVQVVVNIVLARLLSASEYGVATVITVFSTFFYTVSAMGLGTAIIQMKDLDDEDINSIYTFSVYVSLGLSLIFGILSFGIAYFYGNDVYIRLGWMLTIALFFNGMNMVPNGILGRDKMFVTMAVRSATVYTASGLVAVILAYWHFSFYALIIQNIVSAVVTFVWNYLSTKPKFRYTIKVQSIKKIFSYSVYQMGTQIVGYFSNNLDTLLAGKLLGTTQVGYYNKAYTLTNYPINNFSSIIASVLHAVLSDYQNDKEALYKYHIKVNRILALMGAFVGAVCYIAAEEIIKILFGVQWDNSVICFRILSVTIIFRMMNSAINAIYQSLGRTDLLFWERIIEVVVLVIGVVAGIQLQGGMLGLLIGVSVAYTIFYIINICILCKWGFCFSCFKHVKDMMLEIYMCIILILAIVIYPWKFSGLWLSALVKGIYITIVFVVSCMLFERKLIKQILRR